MRPLGELLAAGALGLLAGSAVPVLGALAAAGLTLYFVGAYCAHMRVQDRQLGLWAVSFRLAAAALAGGLYRLLVTGTGGHVVGMRRLPSAIHHRSG
ncbi:DoxX family protein [Streptomyces sp. Ag109_O5-1]|uniref:DoxX family protein n=1 Tax=Streptomyces sp. Ag109_O5-1 TaxID=1938851 RepID=UPI0021A2A12B|nr:DoxX family protein [Streptomyces sp. Ag109_O5-1]